MFLKINLHKELKSTFFTFMNYFEYFLYLLEDTNINACISNYRFIATLPTKTFIYLSLGVDDFFLECALESEKVLYEGVLF